ncbi:hypothetical protein C1645_877854 [Glomus cerebriforme]|uniref:F-box domain-containing protein n=1 Tax=Glomus cerebriforme TaxID=658196 RepID=A0A397SS20_9GLOM|nr:hypothetical protein C1645_877854 [Glomus cerebriforme]
MSQLFADCLNEILEYLQDDMITLHSCLLVNHLWCEVSVRIFWRNSWNYRDSNLRTLIACLPTESKEILSKNGIIITTSTSKPPMYNYASFCKVLSINRVDYKLEKFLKNQQYISLQNLNDITYILSQEIFKLYMNQIGSLKSIYLQNFTNSTFNFYPGTKDCLKNLTELYIRSDISSEFFYQLSKICHNILLLNLSIELFISEGLTDLISVQENLKYLTIDHHTMENLKDLTFSLTKLINLSKLCLYSSKYYFSLSFIINFINLQELRLLFEYDECFKDFEELQYAFFPKLQILNIVHACPKYELLMKFLEINGKNLKECYIGYNNGKSDNLLNLTIAKFCPNLRKLSVGFKSSELETLKIVYNNCQYLESINIWCGSEFLSEKEALELVVNYSHKNLYEIILYHMYFTRSKLLPEDLESFFISWINRVPQKSLCLIINHCYDIKDSLDTNYENMEIINKYIKLGIIKKFEVTSI